MSTRNALLSAGLAVLACSSCAGAKRPAVEPRAELRQRAAASTDGEIVGRWLLEELIAPDGNRGEADKARHRLDGLASSGMYASLARAVDDGVHGRFDGAATSYLAAVRAARVSSDPDASLVAWFSTNHLLGLRASTWGLWEKAKAIVTESLDAPGNLGWRARSELTNWWSQEAYEAAETGIADLTADRHGCLRNVRLSGPFGHAATSDRHHEFEAERGVSWPVRWPADPGRHVAPHLLKTERHGCQVESAEPVPAGVYYAETFIDVPADRDVILAVQGAYNVRVDDVVVLERDTRTWGIWTEFGTHLLLPEGRHRIVARIGTPETSVRLLDAHGAPLGLPSSTDARPLYGIKRPTILGDPNLLSRFVSAGKPMDVKDDTARYLASFLAHVEDQDDVASVLLEPLVADTSRATGPSLAMAAIFAEKDPIFPESDRHDLARDLRLKAVAKDDELWWPKFWLALDEADKRGFADSVDVLRKLADHFQQVPEILQGLANIYGRLGWNAERTNVLRTLSTRFPNDGSVLEQVLGVLDDQGQHAEADRVAARIKQLNLDSTIDVDRALAHHDYPAAVAALKRLGERRPDRKDIADRIADVMTRAGNNEESWTTLERAVAKNPQDAGARLSLADARFSSGDHLALRRALQEAILQGADPDPLASALELVEGTTELDPYRLDGKQIIRDYEASKTEMEGTAARVLDYSAVWVHPDGGSRILEHELIRIQSQEAIGKMAEQRVPEGLVLKLAVIKKDGTILEPEFVAGKPTLTMPHLEVGDYIETENISTHSGDGQAGQRYLGPHWFFREADVAYWRSEFVVIAPKDKPLVIETKGDVPAPVVRDAGPIVTRRWRVNQSPAAPDEPSSAPIQEFLPSVRIGWGIDLKDHLQRLVDAASDELPRDPRILRIARRIAGVGDAVAANETERARRLYRWVLSNVEDGKEGDGRRVVIGKSGNRTSGFLYLCRLLGIPVEVAVTRDRLQAPPPGPISEAETYDDFLVRVSDKSPVWLTVQDKFAPFGYVPANLRGQPAYRLIPGTPTAITGTEGSRDGVIYEGSGELHADGSAVLDLEERFVGKLAIGLRSGIEQMPEAQLHDAIESKLLARGIPGARLVKLSVVNQNDLDQPLVLRMNVEVSALAHRHGRELSLAPPFPIRVSQITALPRRQTPLLIGEPTFAELRFNLKLPPGAQLISRLSAANVRDHDRKVVVKDAQQGNMLTLDRTLDIPSGRVQTDDYPAFREFAEQADQAMLREIIIGVAE